MTVFSLHGTKIHTDHGGQIRGIEATTLDAITRIGINSIDVAYLGDPDAPFSVSLSDYNLVFDKVHINDSELPEHVEYFELVSPDGFASQVLNFVYATEFGWEERMFSVGTSPLPEFKSPAQASKFFAEHEQRMLPHQDDWTIHFDKIDNIQTNGVFITSDQLKTEFNIEIESFEFLDLGSQSDVDVWDIEFARDVQFADAFAATLGTAKDAEVQADRLWAEVESEVRAGTSTPDSDAA